MHLLLFSCLSQNFLCHYVLGLLTMKILNSLMHCEQLKINLYLGSYMY